MNGESFEQIEVQIASLQLNGAPSGLRAAMLADVQRELRAARWDRRLARAAAVLLVVGVGLNLAIALRTAESGRSQQARMVPSGSRQSLVDTAVVVAEATDLATASRFARQLAAMSGRELTADEAAAIEAAVRRLAPRSTLGNKG